MSDRILVATFARGEHLLGAARAALAHGLDPIDAYTPHPVHGLEQVLGWRSSRLPFAAMVYGALGVAFMLWFQLWTSAVNWRINVGGRPWNSSLSFLCVTFEVMVLCAGIGSVLTFLARSRLYPGKRVRPIVAGVTNDTYALVIAERDAGFDLGRVADWLAPYAPLAIDEQIAEDRP